MTAFRKGDVVSVEGVVSADYDVDGKIKVRIEPYTDAFVAREAITMKRPVFAVGDTVCCPEKGHGTATVLAMAEDHLWVTDGAGTYATWWTSLCQRVDPEEKHDPDFDEIEDPPALPSAEGDA